MVIERVKYEKQMKTKTKTEKKQINNYSLFSGLPVQIILLVLHYGNIILLPLWVVWFPMITVGILLTIALIFFLIAMVFI